MFRIRVLLSCLILLPFVALAAPPNIVFILVDDLGYGEMQWYPDEPDISARNPNETDAIKTPNLLRLAKEGVRFTNYRSPAPVCSPSRAAILTSRYPQEFGFRDYLRRDTGRGLPAGTPTIASILKEQKGYRTGHFGKWHLGTAQPQHLPGSHGFDESLVRYGEELTEGYKNTIFIRNDDYAGKGIVVEDEHNTATITNEAISFIESASASGVPYFVNVWYQAPHNPLDPPADFPMVISGYNPKPFSSWESNWAEFAGGIPQLSELAYLEQHSPTADAKSRAMYIATLAWLDYQVGRLLDRINDLDPDGNTIVIFTSDNGALNKTYASGTGDVPGKWVTNGNLRGGKSNVFDGGLRVPLVISWPAANLAEGSGTDLFTLGYDFLPTLIEAAQIPADTGDFVGISVLNALTGEAAVPARTHPIVWEQKSFSSFWGKFDTQTTLDDEQYRYAVWSDVASRKLVADRETGPFVQPHLFDTAFIATGVAGEAPELDTFAAEQESYAVLEEQYRDWRQTVGKIAVEFDQLNTIAAVDGLCIDLDGNREVAQLQKDSRFSFREGDFSFQARVDLDSYPGANGAVIAEKSQSWSLSLAEVAQPGMVEIRLDVQGRNTGVAGFPGATGDLVSIANTVACDIPCSMNVAFTLLGITAAETSARLYVDGLPVAEFRGNGKAPPDFSEVYSDDTSAVRIGNNLSRSAGFPGKIVDPRFYLLSLTPAEVVSVIDEQAEVLCDSGGCH